MMTNQETYEIAVNEQFEKLAKAQTIEELKEVLDTWPEQDNTKEDTDESH